MDIGAPLTPRSGDSRPVAVTGSCGEMIIHLLACAPCRGGEHPPIFFFSDLVICRPSVGRSETDVGIVRTTSAALADESGSDVTVTLGETPRLLHGRVEKGGVFRRLLMMRYVKRDASFPPNFKSVFFVFFGWMAVC